jgi:hypothetical protein
MGLVVDVSGGLSVTGESQFARVRGKLFSDTVVIDGTVLNGTEQFSSLLTGDTV